MKRAAATILAAVLIVLLLGITAHAAKPSKMESFPDVPRITKEELMEKLADSEVIILDVHPEQQWKRSNLKIVGAIHEDPMTIESWADKYPKDKTIVLY